MLQIRLRRDSPTESGSGAKPSPAETVTVACPDHLVLADLPVAKGIGSVTPTIRERVTEAKEIERDGVRDGRVVSEKTWEGARFRRTPAGGREQRRQYGGTQDWYVSGQDLRWLHLLTTTTAATPVKRDAAVVQAGGGVVVVRWRCGGD
ncbi:unnamed protein product [Brassica oleracea]